MRQEHNLENPPHITDVTGVALDDYNGYMEEDRGMEADGQSTDFDMSDTPAYWVRQQILVHGRYGMLSEHSHSST